MAARFDVLIIGAGPAGLCAALRLRQFGYRVMLVERSSEWPRRQIGEALTPGVQNIIDLLDANDALEGVPHLAGRPSRLLWHTRTPEMVPDSGSAIVNRAQFDACLLALARLRGVEVVVPAKVNAVTGVAGDWRVEVDCGKWDLTINTRSIVDARGRGNQSRPSRISCGPRLAAAWVDLPQQGLPADMLGATQTEALQDGWLWGACLPGRRYRIMLVFDSLSKLTAASGRPAARLQRGCAASELFAALSGCYVDGRVEMCSATPYVASDSWRDGRLKVGDAAFALDPISSSGVEKAMRFSLQAAVAIHTRLSDDSRAAADLAQQFFEERLVETCSRHVHWTAESYRQAWCGDQPFWTARALVKFASDESNTQPAQLDRLRQACSQLRDFRPPVLRPLAALEATSRLRLSAQSTLLEAPCVIADRVQLHAALAHPNLARPLAFLENESLFPHLHRLRQTQTLAQVLNQFSTSMTARKASRITAWLWQHGVLEDIS